MNPLAMVAESRFFQTSSATFQISSCGATPFEAVSRRVWLWRFDMAGEDGKVEVVDMRHLRCLWFPVPPMVSKFVLTEVEVLFVAMGDGIVALTDDNIPFIITACIREHRNQL
jgi:hypothetical protein